MINNRTLRSFLILFIFLLGGAGLWSLAKNQDVIDEAPAPFRSALEWNGKLWHALFNRSQLNRVTPPSRGKKLRINGNLGLKPPFDPAAWTVEIITDDQDEKSRRFEISMAEIRTLPKTDASAEFYCIEGWSQPLAYAGVRFSDFQKAYHLPTTLKYVGLETPDEEYYVSVDMDSMLHPQTLLAYELNGEPIDIPHGAPLRLVIPVKYGIKSLKRIGRIFFSDQRPPDYWAERGYDWYAGL